MTAPVGPRILKGTLLLGGVPPLLSGLFAMFFADSYLGFIDEGVASLFDSRAYPLVLVIGSLQGGDAFVAGASRIFVAYWGNVRLMIAFAVVGVLHSAFELWLLPTQLLSWCQTEHLCSDAFRAEVWAFVGLHAVLIAGFAAGTVIALVRPSSLHA